MVPYGFVIHHGVVSALKQPCNGTSFQRTTPTFRASCEHGGTCVVCETPSGGSQYIFPVSSPWLLDAGLGKIYDQSWLPRIDFGGCCSKLRDSFVIQLPVEPIERRQQGELGWMDRWRVVTMDWPKGPASINRSEVD